MKTQNSQENTYARVLYDLGNFLFKQTFRKTIKYYKYVKRFSLCFNKELILLCYFFFKLIVCIFMNFFVTYDLISRGGIYTPLSLAPIQQELPKGSSRMEFTPIKNVFLFMKHRGYILWKFRKAKHYQNKVIPAITQGNCDVIFQEIFIPKSVV